MSYVSTVLKESIVINEIITIHYFEYMKNFTFRGEAHDFWEFLCVDKGQVQVTADDRTYMLKKGDMIFHKPMEFHAIYSKGNTAPNLVVISFKSSSPDMKLFENKIITIKPEHKRLLSRILGEAKVSFSTPIHIPSVEKVEPSPYAPLGSQQLIKLYLEALLIYLARDMQSMQVNPVEKLLGSMSPESSSVLDSILEYLEIHIFEKLTIKKICSDIHLSRSSLESLFKSEKNCGIMDYFSKMKIDRAKEIIRTGEKNMTQISIMLSYSSPQHFTKQFKNISGMTPSEYADSIKGLTESVPS
jgi:AraC-like DNA-binding protein